MEIAEEFICQGNTITKVLDTLNLSSSSFYYVPKSDKGNRGRKKSTKTKLNNGKVIKDQIVIKYIVDLLSREFVDYGYRKVTHWLRQNKGCIINEKKVYRLMKENQLLNKRYTRSYTKRLWVKELVPKPTLAFEYLEFDIKYIWIHGVNTYALLLSVIDVKSRWVLGYTLKWKIKKEDVVELFDRLFEQYPLPKNMYVRNDNGSQFQASMVQQYFKDKKVIQEFCKPATPEQNAHIESYHSIIQKVISSKYVFEDLFDAQKTFERFVSFYNFDRIHSGVNYQSPYNYLKSIGVSLNNFKKSMFDKLNYNFLILQSEFK